jgi:phenylalanyl-tRNA synthetase beta chain
MHTATSIELSQDAIIAKIGKNVDEKNITDILTRLGFVVTFNVQCSTFNVVVPSWRDTGDISIPEDVIEEVARHIGYETIQSEALPGPLATVRVLSHDSITRSISGFFADRGYFDAYTYPFTLEERYVRFSDRDPAVIHNTTENRTHLRAHMAENLLELVANNYRSHTDGAFFEFGPIFDGAESLQGLGVLWGHTIDALQTHLTSYTMTYFGTPGMIIQGTSDTKLFAPKAYGEIVDESGEVVIRFGLIRPTLLPLFDIEGVDVYAFEIVKMPDPHRPIRYIPLIEFPGTRRELNFIMSETTPVATLIELVRTSHEWVSDVGVSDIYRDEKHIGIDKKSVVISFFIQNPQATITDEEAGKIQETVITQLSEKGYQLR